MKRASFLFFLTTATLLAAGACDVSYVSGIGGGPGGTGAGSAGSTGTAPEAACDPLAPKPITLGDIVGVGKDAPGTLYVDATSGVFVSGSGKLLRQHVIGTGQSGDDEYLFTFEAPGDDSSGARNLLVETTGSTADAMALGPSDSKAFLDQSDAGVTPLTLVDPATVSGMATVNTPNVITYVADVANGDVLLATTPMNEDTTATAGGLAIFYGPPGAVAQRAITSFEQSLSGDGTLTFLVDGAPWVLAFGSVYGPDAGPFGTFTLEGLTPQGGAQLATTLRSPTPTSTPPGLSFTCLP
jgi:hypothetical protein